MPRYLLDTGIVSAIADDPFGPVAARVTRHDIDRMCTSIVVAAELRFGAAKKGSKRLLHRIEIALGNLDVQPTTAMPICAPTWNAGAGRSAPTTC